MIRRIMPFILCATLLVTPLSSQSDDRDDLQLLYGRRAQGKLNADLPLNRIIWFGAHNSYSNRNYTLNAGGRTALALMLTPVGVTGPLQTLIFAISLLLAPFGVSPLNLLIALDHPSTTNAILRNQKKSIPELLDVGVLYFELDTHYSGGAVKLCHSKTEGCDHQNGYSLTDTQQGLLGMMNNPNYSFEDALDAFAKWTSLPLNSNDLVIVALENWVGKKRDGSFVPDENFHAGVYQKLQRWFGSSAFTPADLANWRVGNPLRANTYPTARQVREMGKRIVFLLDEKQKTRSDYLNFFFSRPDISYDDAIQALGNKDSAFVISCFVNLRCTPEQEYMETLALFQVVRGGGESICSTKGSLLPCFDQDKPGQVAGPQIANLVKTNPPAISTDQIDLTMAKAMIWSWKTPPGQINNQGSNRCVFLRQDGTFGNALCSDFRRVACKSSPYPTVFDSPNWSLVGPSALTSPTVSASCAGQDPGFDPPRNLIQTLALTSLMKTSGVSEAWIGFSTCLGPGCFGQPIQTDFAATNSNSVMELADVDGDGRADRCELSESGAILCELTTPSPFPRVILQGLTIGPQNTRIWADINADQRADLCTQEKSGSVLTRLTCYTGLAQNDGTPTRLIVQPPTFGTSPSNVQTVALAWINLRPGEPKDFCAAYYFPRKTTATDQTSLLEIKCDGLDGFRSSMSYQLRFSGKFAPRPDSTEGQHYLRAPAFVDVNDDKRPDFCAVFLHPINAPANPAYARQNICFIASPDGFLSNYIAPSDIYVEDASFESETRRGAMWADFNGDGNADLCIARVGNLFSAIVDRYPLVRCEAAYLLPTGKTTFRASNYSTRPDGPRPEEFYLGIAGSGYDRAFGEPVPGSSDANGTTTRLVALDMNADGAADFCVVTSETTADTLSCMVTKRGTKPVLPVRPTDPGSRTLFALEGPTLGPTGVRLLRLDYFQKIPVLRQFIDVNGDGTPDYCLGVVDISRRTIPAVSGFAPNVLARTLSCSPFFY